MIDQFMTKFKILSKLDDFSDLTILSFFPELKQKALSHLVECGEHFISKMHNLFFSQASDSTL
jgi:hypothetical protein